MSNLGNRKWWALGALTLAVLAVGLDGTVLSVALPTLATALHASESDLQWFSSGYLLVLGQRCCQQGCSAIATAASRCCSSPWLCSEQARQPVPTHRQQGHSLRRG